MSTYKVDERDVHFNLFEYLKVQEFTKLDKFKEHNQELYEMVLKEGLKMANNELDPIYLTGDKAECHMKDGVVITPKGYKEAYAKVAQNGFIGIDLNPKYGGQGLPGMVYNAVTEFFTGCNISFEIYAGLSRGASHLIDAFGKPEYGELFCQNMIEGKWSGTMCLTEPQAGTALGDIKTTATPNDDGTYNIKGNKIFISGGDHDLNENIIHLVLGRVEGDQAGTKGLSLFAVPKIWVNPDKSLGEPNDVNTVNVEHKMGIKASATCSLNFGENGKCRGFMIGAQGDGMKQMFKMMNEARLLCGIQGQSIAASAYENAVAYAKERIQGGNKAIIEYPNVRRNLAICKAWVEGMRGLIYTTGKSIDLSMHHSDEQVRERHQNRADLLTPIVKAYCSDMGFKVTEIALQVFGGYGYCSEYPMEQFLRDVKIASIYEGTNGVQALDLIGRKLAIKEGKLFREYYEDLSAFASKHAEDDQLKDHIGSFKKALDTVGQIAMKIAEWGMSDQKTKALLSATPFLEMVGHTTLAHILLDQAILAKQKIQEGTDDSFYRNKIRTAKFFVTQILPQVQMRAKNILSEDLNAMEMEF